MTGAATERSFLANANFARLARQQKGDPMRHRISEATSKTVGLAFLSVIVGTLLSIPACSMLPAFRSWSVLIGLLAFYFGLAFAYFASRNSERLQFGTGSHWEGAFVLIIFSLIVALLIAAPIGITLQILGHRGFDESDKCLFAVVFFIAECAIH